MTLPASPSSDSSSPQNPRNLWISIVSGVLIVAVTLVIVALAHSGDGGSTPAATGTSGVAATNTSSTAAALPPSTSPPVTPPATGAPSGQSGRATTDQATTGQTSTDAASGCAATGAGVPKGAGTHRVVDVDGDGKPDTAWITPGAERRVGITTASGATFSAPIDSASPERATAIVQRVEPDGVPIVLVDTGREVLLYSAAGCHLTETQNADGSQYSFDKGFTGYGTGVECVPSGDSLRLAGLLATKNDGKATYKVTRTFVLLEGEASEARNGATDVVAKSAVESSSNVKRAHQTTCGGLVAGEDGPTEPSS